MELLIVLVFIAILIYFNPDIWERFVRNSQLLKEQRQQAAVLNKFVTEMEKTSEDSQDLEWIATLKAISGNHREAIADFTRAIERNPTDATLYFNRGQARYSIDDRRGAYEDYEKAIALAPDYASAYISLGRILLELGDYNESIAQCNYALSLQETNTIGYTVRGKSYAKLGDRTRALADFNRAIEYSPDNIEAQRCKARL